MADLLTLIFGVAILIFVAVERHKRLAYLWRIESLEKKVLALTDHAESWDRAAAQVKINKLGQMR